MPFTPKNIDHVVVCVSDLERALKFYCDVLGCSEERLHRRPRRQHD
jgi:catechol 2,3-dioxygenase-like lactoylglutathione lyase family enzyme